jgi:hypothetical protein
MNYGYQDQGYSTHNPNQNWALPFDQRQTPAAVGGISPHPQYYPQPSYGAPPAATPNRSTSSHNQSTPAHTYHPTPPAYIRYQHARQTATGDFYPMSSGGAVPVPPPPRQPQFGQGVQPPYQSPVVQKEGNRSADTHASATAVDHVPSEEEKIEVPFGKAPPEESHQSEEITRFIFKTDNDADTATELLESQLESCDAERVGKARTLLVEMNTMLSSLKKNLQIDERNSYLVKQTKIFDEQRENEVKDRDNNRKDEDDRTKLAREKEDEKIKLAREKEDDRIERQRGDEDVVLAIMKEARSKEFITNEEMFTRDLAKSKDQVAKCASTVQLFDAALYGVQDLSKWPRKGMNLILKGAFQRMVAANGTCACISTANMETVATSFFLNKVANADDIKYFTLVKCKGILNFLAERNYEKNKELQAHLDKLKQVGAIHLSFERRKIYSGTYNLRSLHILLGLYGGKIPYGLGFMPKNGVHDDNANPLFASSDDPFLFHYGRSDPVQSDSEEGY